ncbi:hypothetical protein OAO87_04205 [bacterium]|nr:hypothetical protein [bacterium]
MDVASALNAMLVRAALATQQPRLTGRTSHSALDLLLCAATGSARTLDDACRCDISGLSHNGGGFCFCTQRRAGMGSAGNAAAEARRANATLDALTLNHALLWAAQAHSMTCAAAAASGSPLQHGVARCYGQHKHARCMCRCGISGSPLDSGGWCFGTQRRAGTTSAAAEARHANATLDALTLSHALLWAAQARSMTCANAAAQARRATAVAGASALNFGLM